MITIVCLSLISAVVFAESRAAKMRMRITETRPTNTAIDAPARKSQPVESLTFESVGQLDRSVIAGGGGSSNSDRFRVDGTIGQASAGTTMNGQQFSLTGGFWQPEQSASPSTTIQFLSTMVAVNESNLNVVVTVTRTGVISGTSSVRYRTTDTDSFTVPCSDSINNQGAAFGRCDYSIALDTLTFLPGETSKALNISIVNDSWAEASESFSVVLSNPSGATLGSPSVSTVMIVDNDSVNGPNPIFNTSFFVRQHYLDFLSREPEAGEPWTNVLNNCSDVNNNPACDRLTVSGAFFGSPEFQLKGYFVYRFYKLAFNRLPQYTEIVVDMRGVTGATPAEVFQKKAAFPNDFVLLPEFVSQYNAMSNTQYVNTLMGRYGLPAITTPNPATPDDNVNKVMLTTTDLVNGLNTTALTRAQVLRAIADSDQVFQREFNPAFVAMQYFGYLRRSPETTGYNAWLTFLNANPTQHRTMINGFLNSSEYRLRFGPVN